MARALRYFFTVVARIALLSLVIGYITRVRTSPFKGKDGFLRSRTMAL